MKRKVKYKKVLAFVAYNFFIGAILAPFIVFWGPFDNLKSLAVGSIATSRHPQVARAFLSQEKIDEIMNSESQVIAGGEQINSGNKIIDNTNGIIIEDIQGQGFKGKVMLIKDPKQVKLAVTKEIGVVGERVSDLVRDTGAVAGINAGGFYDPSGKGNGAFPDGLTVHNGEIIHNNIGNEKTHFIGLDKQGKLIVDDLTPDQVLAKGIMEGVSFFPDLVVDGKPVVKGSGGWGINPRSAIGQTADGTIILVTIDGRLPTWSIGATLRSLMDVFINYHAVTAVNLDGGSSTTLVYQGKVINRVCDLFGERYIPTAFVVMPKGK
ncbi:MAG: phosphodiester glycosidase family protein [Peptococcaceae bacterium]|nr:phosphodiester glycosidase family protein [Peptococcaceae bacterium]